MINKSKIVIILALSLTLLCCKSKLNNVIPLKTDETIINKTLISSDWQYKDLSNDSLLGISLDRAYNELLNDKKGEEIIVAVIDTEIDIDHEDLKNQIWTNSKEIQNNKKDDDGNGYIDDIHGWNFLGNQNGENIIYSNFEYTRIVKTHKTKFDGKTKSDFSSDDLDNFIEYKRAKTSYDSNLKIAKSDLDYIEKVVGDYYSAKEALKEYFPNEKYTLEKLKSIDTTGNNLYPHVKSISAMVQYGVTEAQMQDQISSNKKYIDYYLNLEYNDRQLLEDDPENINDKNYGNNNVSGNLDYMFHGTLVAGIISANRENELGIKGFSNNIKIMPLCVSSYGDEYDKDIALAIRYAVDNGAKVINMSSSKSFSLKKEMVTDALLYATKKDVLFVKSASNENLNLDYNDFYPSPKYNNITAVEKNFITVGGSGKKINKSVKTSFSNFGKNTVDIFAPAQDLKTTAVNNTYILDSGTSLAAPIVSGVAALLRSYYPNLEASETKEIIMKSGTSLGIDVEIKQGNGTKKLIPFSELSKSGKVVNAYNALLMAEQISNTKK